MTGVSAAYAPPSSTHPRPPPQQHTVGTGCGLDVHDDRVAHFVGAEELLPPGENQPHRPTSRPGERGHVGLEVKVALAAEPAAEQRHDHPHMTLGDLERVGHSFAGQKRHLGSSTRW